MDSLFQLLNENYIATWTIITACCCSLMCAWLGVWLVLQRMSMLGDAISHSVLPGLILVYIFFGLHSPLPMAIGAALAGLLTIALMKGLSSLANIHHDSSMGIVFTVLFAIGVILINRYADHIDLDPSCVLYGLIEFVAIDTRQILGYEIPKALTTIFPALIITGAFLAMAKKELLIMAFDPYLAKTLGKKPDLFFYLLMSIVAIVTVASFESVGSILVIAMLIGPAATAQLVTKNIRSMFAAASVVAIFSSIIGYYMAVWLNTSIAGMMSVAIGIFYLLGVLYTKIQIWQFKKAELGTNP